jgi:hypothetical protein
MSGSNDLMRKVVAMLGRYISAADHVLDVCALWVLHCWAIAEFYTTGRLIIESPEPECGKSTLLDMLAYTLDDPVSDVSITGAAVTRILQQRTTTFLLDECDKNIGRKDADQNETFALLLSIANKGYRRGATRTVCMPPKWEPVSLPTFAPMAFAGLNSTLDKAFRTRAIHVWLDRDEPEEEFEWGEEIEAEFLDLRDAIRDWVDRHRDAIKATKIAKNDRPAGLKARAAEVWLPLFRIAVVVGGNWPDRVEAAFDELGAKSRHHQQRDLSVKLLDAAWAAPWVTIEGEERIHTEDLLALLNTAEESWSTWNDGEGIRAYEFTRHVVDHFHLHRSQQMRIGEKNRKGYKRDWFRDAHERYVPPDDDPSDPLDPSTPRNARNTETSLTAQRKGGETISARVSGSDGLHPLSDNGRVGVSASRGGYRNEDEPESDERDEPDTLDAVAEWERVRIAAIRGDDPDHGTQVARARAEAARRRIALKRTATS